MHPYTKYKFHPLNKLNYNLHLYNMEKNESEFMYELRKAVHAYSTNILVNKICGFINACIAELKITKQFTHNDHTFTYYLN